MKNLSPLIIKISFFISLIINLHSCNPVYYPNSLNTPMLKNKGEGQINLMAGTAGFEMQTAYAVTNNWGLMLNGNYISSTKNDSIKEVRTLGEFGLGYSKKISEMGQFEVFGGAGFGKAPADFRNSIYDGSQKTNLIRFFIQPAIGLSSKSIDFSFASRFVAVNAGHETNLFVEPGFVAKMGYKNFKFIGTLGLSIPMKNSNERNWDQNPILIGIGLHYNFGRKYTE